MVATAERVTASAEGIVAATADGRASSNGRPGAQRQAPLATREGLAAVSVPVRIVDRRRLRKAAPARPPPDGPAGVDVRLEAVAALEALAPVEVLQVRALLALLIVPGTSG